LRKTDTKTAFLIVYTYVYTFDIGGFE
ncbi:MAG: hypothetical protein RI974_525, partial [Actinomycetota bacterium]